MKNLKAIKKIYAIRKELKDLQSKENNKEYFSNKIATIDYILLTVFNFDVFNTNDLEKLYQ